jgi:hypothetical protein
MAGVAEAGRLTGEEMFVFTSVRHMAGEAAILHGRMQILAGELCGVMTFRAQRH